MDNLTHTLAGVMLSRAGLNRFAPRATLLLAVAANMPDVDVVSWLGGPLVYLQYHRWWTHALALTPLLAVVPALLVWLLERRRASLLWLWLMSLVGVVSHPLLDYTNVYGIRMLLPFSSSWVRLDTVGVVDLWIWAILLLGLAAPALSRLVSSEIGARRTPGRGWAWFVLVLVAGYEWGRYVAHGRAIETLEARVYDGRAPLRTAAFPSAGNPLRWRALVETDSDFRIYDLDLLGAFDPTRDRRYYKPEPRPAIEAASRTEPFRVFLNFSPFTLWRVTPPAEPDGPTLVQAFDLRFGEPSSPGFIAVAEVAPDLKITRSEFTFGRVRPR